MQRLGTHAIVSRVWVVGLGLALLLSFAGSARARDAAAVRIVSPRPGVLVTSRLVTVRVRTARSALRLHVGAYGNGVAYRNISARFRRTGPGAFSARLRLGGVLGQGVNWIYVTARKRSGARVGDASRSFTIARPTSRAGSAPGSARPLLTVQRFEHGRYERPPLDIRVLARPGATIRALLNGRGARRSFERRRGGRWVAHLGVKDGLRFGANRLVVTAFTRSGLYQRVSKSVLVSRRRPLVDAGRDMQARVGRGVRPNGKLTRGARGRRLILRWRVVARPHGPRPRLLDASKRRPVLIPHVKGTYRLRLYASYDRRGARAVASTASVGSGGARAVTAVAPGSTDTDDMVVDAAPDAPPSGVPVQTIDSLGGQVGTSVEGNFYPLTAGDSVQLLALNRTTLTVDKSASYAANQMGQLLSDLNNLPTTNPDCLLDSSNPDLVILSGDGQAASYDGTDAADLQQAIDQIGGILSNAPTTGVASGAVPSAGNGQSQGDWSVVGIPGISQGQAYQLIGLQQGAGATAGAMSGNFQIDSTGCHYAFTWAPEYDPYDTSRSRTATQNEMVIDANDYASSNLPLAGHQADTGYQLMWLDADTLKVRASETFGLDALDGLAATLRSIIADPKPGLLFLNTIGDVQTPFYTAKPGSSGDSCQGAGSCPGAGSDGNNFGGIVFAQITTLLQEFGANPYVYIMAGSSHPGDPGTSGGYSLVGVTGLARLQGPNAGAELSTRMYSGTIARLTGLLTRSRQGVLTPSSSTSPGVSQDPTVLEPSLQQVLGRPAQPFKPFSTPGEQAAQLYIEQGLDLTVDPNFGIRGLYWQTPTLDWDHLQSQLMNLPPCATNPCAGSYSDVEQTLSKEFGEVEDVRNALIGTDGKGGLYGLFNDVFIDQDSFKFQGIINIIQRSFEPPLSAIRGPSALGILSGALGIAGGIGGFVPFVGEEFAAVTEVGAGIADIYEASDSDGGGESVFDPYGFHSTTAALATDLGNAYQNITATIDQAYDLIVSDAGRLDAADPLARKSVTFGGWLLGNANTDQITGRLEQTSEQFMWLTMAQPVFATYECAREDEGGVTKHNPAAVLPTNINFPPLPSPNINFINTWWNLYPTWIVLATRNHWGFPTPVSKTITNQLFAPGGVGFRPEYFDASANAAYVGSSGGSNYYNKNLAPASYGLLHKNMNMWKNAEFNHGLSLRVNWSMYTPACGWGQRLRWSDPDPNAPASRDPVASSTGGAGPHDFDSQWDPSTNPFANP